MVKVMYGFDCERPFGPQALTETGIKEMTENHEMIRKINDLFDDFHAKRTLFILADSLLKASKVKTPQEITHTFRPYNTFIEHGSHTVNHITIQEIPTRPDKVPVSKDELSH